MATRAGNRRVVDWTQEPLGLVPDAEIALRRGVTRQAVARQRLARGIPAAGHVLRGAPALTREDMTELRAGVLALFDSAGATLTAATASVVGRVPGWACELTLRRGEDTTIFRFAAPRSRRWTEWMAARRARAWLLAAGWADEALRQVDELRRGSGAKR